MRCPKCQAEIPAQSRFCLSCGHRISTSQALIGDGDAADMGAAATAADSVLPNGEGVGSLINSRYRIEAVLGHGGMGIVYKATDTMLARTVAVKRLIAAEDAEQKAIDDFLREAHVIASLSHPHIITIFDRGEDDHGPYLVMQYIDGPTLAELLGERGPMSWNDAKPLFLPVAQALEYAHQRTPKVIHRDVKPGNVLLERVGRGGYNPKVADFGLAGVGLLRRGVDAEHGCGTPAYVAPEQAENALHADERSDIYSLGKMLMHMLTGKVSVAVVEGELPADLAPGLRAAILRAVSRAPQDRPYSVTEFLRELEAAEAPAVAEAAPADTQASPEKRIACPACGNAEKPDAQNCTRCGAELYRACPNGECGSVIPAADELCPHCGVHVQNFKQGAEALAKARRLLRACDYPHARDEAQKALALSPGATEARAVLEEARGALARLEELHAQLVVAEAEEDFAAAEARVGELLKLQPNDNALPLKMQDISRRRVRAEGERAAADGQAAWHKGEVEEAFTRLQAAWDGYYRHHPDDPGAAKVSRRLESARELVAEIARNRTAAEQRLEERRYDAAAAAANKVLAARPRDERAAAVKNQAIAAMQSVRLLEAEIEKFTKAGKSMQAADRLLRLAALQVDPRASQKRAMKLRRGHFVRRTLQAVAVLVILVLGAGGYFGWRTWQARVAERAGYEALVSEARQGLQREAWADGAAALQKAAALDYAQQRPECRQELEALVAATARDLPVRLRQALEARRFAAAEVCLAGLKTLGEVSDEPQAKAACAREHALGTVGLATQRLLAGLPESGDAVDWEAAAASLHAVTAGIATFPANVREPAEAVVRDAFAKVAELWKAALDGAVRDKQWAEVQALILRAWRRPAWRWEDGRPEPAADSLAALPWAEGLVEQGREWAFRVPMNQAAQAAAGGNWPAVPPLLSLAAKLAAAPEHRQAYLAFLGDALAPWEQDFRQNARKRIPGLVDAWLKQNRGRLPALLRAAADNGPWPADVPLPSAAALGFLDDLDAAARAGDDAFRAKVAALARPCRFQCRQTAAYLIAGLAEKQADGDDEALLWYVAARELAAAATTGEKKAEADTRGDLGSLLRDRIDTVANQATDRAALARTARLYEIRKLHFGGPDARQEQRLAFAAVKLAVAAQPKSKEEWRRIADELDRLAQQGASFGDLRRLQAACRERLAAIDAGTRDLREALGRHLDGGEWEAACGKLKELLKVDANAHHQALLAKLETMRAECPWVRVLSRAQIEGALLHDQDFARTVKLGDGVSLRLIYLPAGRFEMGSPKDEGEADERPAHAKEFRKGFYISIEEITQRQWAAVMGEGGAGKLPKGGVSWDDAMAFIKKVNARGGKAIFDLPSETEWEYACRAGARGARFVPDGETIDAYAWHKNNSSGSLQASGAEAEAAYRRRPNPWGLYDMYGNLWEWCHDVGQYVAAGSLTTDALNARPGGKRALRGGGFESDPADCRSARRLIQPQDKRDPAYGFRVICTGD